MTWRGGDGRRAFYARRPFSRARAGGFQVVELLVVVAVIGLLLILGLPNLFTAGATLRVRLGCEEIMAVLYSARMSAVRLGTNVAVQFQVGDHGVRYQIFRDGDGDGVCNADIRTGTDPPLSFAADLRHLGRGVGFGFPPGKPPRDPGDPSRRLDRLDDPIRFNRSDLASFSSLGTATPGSVYLTDGRRELMVVRLLGTSGRIETLRYDPDREAWY